MERELLPWSRSHAFPLMAHSPLATGSLFHHPALRVLADQHGCTTAQLALAWVLRHAGMCALVRASSSAHVRQNRCALELRLDAGALDALDRAFPVPHPPLIPHPPFIPHPMLTRRYAVS
jgi:diketogulonate reductase-like aldo/keto reductase